MREIKISPEQKKILSLAVRQFENYFSREINSPVCKVLQFKPPELIDFNQSYQEVGQLLNNAEHTVNIKYFPFLKAALVMHRRNVADSVEERASKTFDPKSRTTLDKQLEIVEELLNEKWFIETEPYRCPQISDFLSIKAIEEWKRLPELDNRTYDEKFGILMAPTLFFKDLNHFRLHCDLRNVTLMVAYIDIDSFKDFNKNHGESQVDRLVLPTFMKSLEEQCFSRGYAYRFGGDEYVLIIPNIDREEGIIFLDKLHRKIRDLKFHSINDPISISIGAYFVNPYCSQTNSEIERAAEKAKNHAKTKGGKDCTAICEGNSLSSTFTVHNKR